MSTDLNKTNWSNLYKSFLFPALGLIACGAMIAVKGLPPVFWGILAFAGFVVGSVEIVADYNENGETSVEWPMAVATVVPVLSIMFGFA